MAYMVPAGDNHHGWNLLPDIAVRSAEVSACHEENIMPAKSKAQQKAAGAALSAKRGETPVSDLQGASKEMYASMTKEELEDFASTDHEDLPARVSKD